MASQLVTTDADREWHGGTRHSSGVADHRGRWYTPPSRANCAATARARASAWSAPQARCRWGAQRRGGSACRLSSGEGRAVVARHGCCCDWRISLTDDGHECEAPYGAFLEGQLGQGCGSSRTVRACRELTRGNGGEGGSLRATADRRRRLPGLACCHCLFM